MGMRALALSLVLLAAVALAGIGIQPAIRFEFTDCASGGSANQTVTGGQYLMRVTDADVFVCYASTCASAGERFPVGTVLLLQVPALGQVMSCRSSTSTGDFILTSAN
jgi:hypothetical protein